MTFETVINLSIILNFIARNSSRCLPSLYLNRFTFYKTPEKVLSFVSHMYCYQSFFFEFFLCCVCKEEDEDGGG